jgi:pyruvate/2-oxoglutarate/acetoin dehydrogenase E1 component
MESVQVIFFEHVLLYNLKGSVGGKEDVACLEKAELVREGKDCVIFTYSRMRWTVMQAAAQLEKEVRGWLHLVCCTLLAGFTTCHHIDLDS